MNAEEHDNLLAAIERDQAWLDVLLRRHPHPPCPSLVALKERVRLEIDTLALDIDPAISAAQAVAAAKSAVRAELRRMAPAVGPAYRRKSWWYGHRVVIGTLAAAAVVALFFVLPSRIVPPGGGEDPEIPGAWTDWQTALLTPATEEIDSDVAALSTDIDVLYDALSLGGGWELVDGFDELDAELDELFNEFDALGDV